LAESERDKPYVLVSESVARRFFPGEDAAGKHLLMDVMSAKPSTVEIVGVVGDTHDFALDIDPEPTLYQIGASPHMMLVVRTSEDPARMTAPIRRAVTSANQDQVAGEIRTMDQIVSHSLGQRRFALLLMGGFALIAVALAGIGIYGVIAYSVTKRTRELGLRMALGAQPSDVVRLLFRGSLTTLAPGLAIGCLLAFALTRLMSALLYHVAPADPLAYGGAMVFLVLVGSLATFIPARRATAIDPMQALREQ
jgi:putative ABC transport system permease protein